MNKPRHFLDISELPTQELRSMLALSSAMKVRSGRSASTGRLER